jgi:hypothetical protein
MGIEDWPVVSTAEFLSAYELDRGAPDGLQHCAGSASLQGASDVADLWRIAIAAADAGVMILTLAKETWIAAGSVLIAGKPGLNVGLMMSALRALPRAKGVPAVKHGRPADAVHRTLWDIALRLDRVEADRLMEFRAEGSYRFLATKAGFDLMDGATVADFRRDVATTVAEGKRVKYRLLPWPDLPAQPRLRVADLFCDANEGRQATLGSDLWPTALPKGISLAELAATRSLCDQMSRMGAADGMLLTLVDTAGRPSMKVRRDGMVWAIDLSLPFLKIRR